MKKLLFILMILGLASCEPLPAHKKQMTADGYAIVVIDGCEYIEVSFAPGISNGYYSLTHKGNCKNQNHCK